MTKTGPRLTPLELLARLVSFDTESQKSNLPLIHWVAEYLDAWGVPYVIAPNEAGDKAALFATVGPMRDGDRNRSARSSHASSPVAKHDTLDLFQL